MKYDPSLDIPVNSKPIHITIEDAFYAIRNDGKIEIVITTKNKEYELFIRKDKNYSSDKIINTPTIHPFDQFDVYISYSGLFITEYWVLINQSDIVTYSIDIDRNLTVCPSCKQPITISLFSAYCLNSICPAKIKMTIRRFLNFAVSEEWISQELLVIDKLVDSGTITKISDLYSLSNGDIESILYYDGITSSMALGIISKLQRTIGKVSIYSFLYSLAIPHTNEWVLLRESLFSDFHTMEEFLIWFEQAESDTVRPIQKYMSLSAYTILLEYFSIEANCICIEELINFGVFII